MAVAIRLKKAGAKKNAFYHVVATDSRKARDGKYIEKLGYYDPLKTPTVFTINRDRLEYWISVGAKTSRTVSQLVAKHGQAGPEASGAEKLNS